MKKLRLLARVPLTLGAAGEASGPGLGADLSAAAVHGDVLWLANDERAHVERLTRQGDGGYGDHRPFELAPLLDLPAGGKDGAAEEVDIEGLAVEDGYLWIVGSHSAARRKPKAGERDPQAILARLTEVRDNPSRCLLARVPIDKGKKHGARLVREDGGRSAACLRIDPRAGSELSWLLGRDEHLGRFIGVTAKENAFDIEGLAVEGERVWLGLRGPVLRGWAVIIELKLREAGPGELSLDRLDGSSARYRKHFLDLHGLGIRELCRHERDLLILAGPTMDIDGPVRVHRWADPAARTSPVTDREHVPAIGDVPFGQGTDHAEGLSLIQTEDGKAGLLVIYDSPDPSRVRDGGRTVLADLLELPGA